MRERKSKRPVVGLPCDLRFIPPHPFHAVGEKYIAAVDGGADCKPVLLPVAYWTQGPGAFDISRELDDIFGLCDGIFLTGSPSNVHPSHYGGTPPREGVLLDENRDRLTLDLIRACAAREVPLLCVCRGFQEMNVAFGGSLHQHLHEMEAAHGYEPRFDHRERKDQQLEVQYAPAHQVRLVGGGRLAGIVGKSEIMVNSLHGQGIDRLAPPLQAEAYAADGTLEAASLRDAKSFTLGVQWHPEWRYWENEDSIKLLRAFGDAVRRRAALREPALPAD